MRFEIYHQLGYRDKWNIESIRDDRTGDGGVILPRSVPIKRAEGFPARLKERALFDPMFSNPAKASGEIESYGFHPNTLIPGGYSPDKFRAFSSIIAEDCVEFQIRNNFRFIVIPALYSNEIEVNRYIDDQESTYVTPFLETLKKIGKGREVILQVILNGNMLKDNDFREGILTWITDDNKDISGIYLITELKPRRIKQIEDIRFLHSLLDFINVLRQNELITILGYLNTESILLSIANPSIVTVGSFEIMRIFDQVRLDSNEEGGPARTRIYVPKLLDWIDQDYIGALVERFPDFRRALGDNPFIDTLAPAYNWLWNQQKPYRHYFIEISKQLRELNNLQDKERYERVCTLINTAISEFSKIQKDGTIILEDYGSHLTKWLSAANLFASEQGWVS